MKYEKLPSGSYRVRKMRNGKTYTLIFDHKPTQKEVDEGFYEQYRMGAKIKEKSVKKCISEYIDSREQIASPSTLRSYRTLERSVSDAFGKMNIYQVEQIDIQAEINRYASNHAPHTVRNYSGLISAVFGTFRPTMIIHTTLPQKKPSCHYKPTENDVRRILEASANSKYHIAFQLGVMGLRRGEIAGLDIITDLDVKNNTLHIHKVLVESENGWVIKEVPKTDTSNREIELPQALVDEINMQGFIIDVTPPMLVEHLHKYQDKLGIERFRFHDLRHYFASYLHSLNIPDVYIMEMGGWKSNYTMDKIYKEAMQDKSREMKKMAANSLLSNF